MGRRRMVVIGLDCAAPELVFERYRGSMPNLAALIEGGTWGPLRSSEPPITVPAWTCMVSGRDPGQLGLYGFRNRVAGETGLRLANGSDVRVKRVWDWLGDHGFRVAPLFVPMTSPPTPVRGEMISDFMWPGDETPWCFPSTMAAEIEDRFGRYRPDVENFRTHEPERILGDIYAMTEQHFDIARYVWSQKEPDFMMMVEIGLDRFHHAFWRHIDPLHPRHEPGNRWADSGRQYYAMLDAQIGKLRELTGGETTFLVVSDHGARAMRGGFCINEWLIRRGYLVLKEASNTVVALTHDRIDWPETRVWAEGGYYGRIFLNIEGREPEGRISSDEATILVRELRRELETLTDDEGNEVPTRVRDPRNHYREARGFPPDLMIYFDDLALRAVGSIGHGRLVVHENDTGPDTCNHDWNGIFVMNGPDVPAHGLVAGAEIYDVTPTILSLFGVERPPGILGRDWTA